MLPPLLWDSYGLNRLHSGIHSYARDLFFALKQQGLSPTVHRAPSNWTEQSFELNDSKLSWMLKSFKLDVSVKAPYIYHSLCNFNLPVGLRWQKGVRRILTVHDLIPLFVAPYSLQALQLRLVLPQALQQADCIIAVSQWSKDTLNDVFPGTRGKTVVVRHGVPKWHRQTTPPKQGQSIHLLSVSRYEPYKRFGLLFDILRLLPPHVELTLVTNVLGQGYASEKAGDLVDGGRLNIVVGLSSAKLYDYYERSHLYVHPSLFEGFCFPIAEAMSVGCPVLCSATSALTELVNQPGYSFGHCIDDHSSAAVWADEILQMVATERTQTQLNTSKQAYSALHTWDDCAAEVRRIYEG